jgi:lysyl-tRNA synthetase, class II
MLTQSHSIKGKEMTFHEPEYHRFEEYQNRLTKLREIKELGIEPYPHHFKPCHDAGNLQDKYAAEEIGHSEDAAQGKTPNVCLAGRLVLFRAMGKNAFAQLQDESGRIQLMFNRDLTEVAGLAGDSPMKFIEKKIDLGDIIGVEGNLFRTQKGELTLFVKKMTLLCKVLLPLPDKHSGLADKGTRYRKRWLDLITHPEVATHFRLRSQILHIIRNYFNDAGFLEVETPVLQNVYGGAQAKPFMTKLNALDQEMFLRISLEIPLKKLIVGGMDRVFEIGKVFRNEGIDRTHNPEFTELEVYGAYLDYNDMMVLTENLFEKIALELYGTTELTLLSDDEKTEYTVELKAPWKRISMIDSVKEYAGIDVKKQSDDALKKILKERSELPPADIDKANHRMLIVMLFEELVEEKLIQPHHIIDHPIETTPLCKLHRDPELAKAGYVERFETFILGHEFCNSYTELNDPVLQRELLLSQAEKKLAGDEEANPLDEEFIESICQGMPPAGGLGMGVDRIVMLFTKAHSIRDVLYFPLMRPED